jgi:hypothetical protein
MKNVLVFPCGSEIGLEVHRALAHSIHFSLYGASSVDDHGKFVYRNYIGGLPHIDSPDFIDRLNPVLEQHGIDFIVPAHDSAVLKMAEHQALLRAQVITSPAETCRVCRSKRATYARFSGILATPKVYLPDETMAFPVFLKPDVGQGSKGTYKADTVREVQLLVAKDPSLVAMEYLPGREYTVDCFSDRTGALRFAEGRERSRIFSGISVNSKEVHDARFQDIAGKINETLSFRGVWFFQLKERSSGELVLMEVAARMAGTMALFRVDGVNFAQLALFDRMGLDVAILRNKLDIEIDRALTSRFSIKLAFSHVYIDFDDTIIMRDLVNTDVMKLLYQFKNAGKRIVLLSRHTRDISLSLARHCISAALFDEIYVMDKSASKSDYIKNLDSIFIDDSFAERKEVFERLHVPVFALDGVEALVD